MTETTVDMTDVDATQTAALRRGVDPRPAPRTQTATETIAFLRAVNVGARTFAAADIRRVVEALGFTDVETHINTGNVFFRGGPADRHTAEAVLEEAFAADRGFEVPVIAFTPPEFRAVADHADAITSADLERHYVYLLKEELPPDALMRIAERASATGRVVVSARAAHVLLGPGYQDGRVDPLNVARLFGVATNRNLTVVRAIAEKWAGAR